MSINKIRVKHASNVLAQLGKTNTLAVIDQRNDLQIRHLYRSLLRATSYLPDSLARSFMREQVTRRFRQNDKKGVSKQVLDNRIKRAKRSCRILEGAGELRAEELKEVLLRTYGRKGPRKRVLIKELIQKDEDQAPSNDEELAKLIANPSKKTVENYEPTPKFLQFLRSQQANQPLELSATIKTVKPVIPEANIWLRPVPAKARNGLRHKWWVVTLEKLSPPVPVAEWNRLRDFATGSVRLERAPPRRSVGTSRYPSESDWVYDAKNAVDFLNRRLKEDVKCGYKDYEERDFIPSRAKDENKLDPTLEQYDSKHGFIGKGLLRFPKVYENTPKCYDPQLHEKGIRRLYATVWSMTPTMVQDEVSKRWEITWGGARSAAHNGAVSTPTKAQEEFFEGLENLVLRPMKGPGLEKKNRKEKDVQKISSKNKEQKNSAFKFVSTQKDHVAS